MEWADARIWAEILGTPKADDDQWIRDKLFHIHGERDRPSP